MNNVFKFLFTICICIAVLFAVDSPVGTDDLNVDGDLKTENIKNQQDAFSVVVKDLKIAGKTVRISPFAGVGGVTVNFCFKNVGQKLSPENKEVLVALLTRSLGEATLKKTKEELQSYSRAQNVHVNFSSDDDNFIIIAKCPSNKIAELFVLLKEMLFEAKFNNADLKRFKVEMHASLMQAMQSPNAELEELVKEVVYKNHPYGTLNKSYISSLNNVDEADLKAYISSHFTQENLIISACGEFDEVIFVEQLSSFITALPKNLKIKLPKNIEINKPYKTYSKQFSVPQTVMKFLHKGIDPHHPDFFALQIATSCLSDSFVGLLIKKIREEKGLVYGIGARFVMSEHFNGFFVSTATQTENVEKVIAAVHEVFVDICKNGFSDELVENIKQSFVGNYKRSFASSGAIALRLTNYQLINRPVDFHKTVISSITNLTSQQVTEAFKRFFNADQFIVFKVGQ